MPPAAAITAPDPFEPSDPPAAIVATAHRKQLARQRPVRARILAATRRLLGDGIDARLTLGNVAAAADVSVQTVRNHFGRRDDLIVSAVNDHTSTIWHVVTSQRPGALAFLTFPEVIRDVAIRYPGFLRASIETAFSQRLALTDLQRHASANKLAVLRGLAGSGDLRDGIDPRVLASQITRLDSVMMFEWSRSGDGDTLFQEMRAAHRMLMIGALRPPAAARLELAGPGWAS